MRERLVAAFVGLTIVVVALYGVPRAYFLADLVRDQEQARVDRSAALAAIAVGEREKRGEAVDRAFVARLADDDETVVVRPEKGRAIWSADPREAEDADISTSADVPGGGTVTVTRHGSSVNDEIAQALLPLVLLGLLLVLLAGAAGFVISRRMARPFQELATAARDLGTGRLHPDLPTYRVPEARAIADALLTSGHKLDALLQHERDVAAHASHELRTPVTALRLELEDLALWPETPPGVAAQLQRSIGELDRLSTAIGDLLAESRTFNAAAEIDLDLDALLADTVSRLAATGRSVRYASAGPLPTHLDPQPVIQALELLLGSGSAVVAVDRDTHLEVTITNATPPDDQPPQVWEQASELAAAAGGGLARAADGVVLRIPKRPVGTA